MGTNFSSNTNLFQQSNYYAHINIDHLASLLEKTRFRNREGINLVYITSAFRMDSLRF